ncbi:MAG: hypothetical protein QG597_4917 [Actinomycetota bacterium]|nr:hypothetical protein [Actinomycetota bacterium]
MADYAADIAKYTTDVDEEKVKKIVTYCGIALRNRDSSLVSAGDPKELATVRDGFAAKKLGLSADEAEAAIAKVMETMAGVKAKSRVTVYYLLAEQTGTLDKLG